MNLLMPPEMLDGTLPDLGIFLAGGITGCPDWQSELMKLLCPNEFPFYVCNPRRTNFDINDPSMSEEQIEWEQHWLWYCGVVTFWFCKESVQPIALYELGQQAARLKMSRLTPNNQIRQPALIVGMDPDYPRAADVRKQLRLCLWDGVISETLSGHARMIVGHLRRIQHRKIAEAAKKAMQQQQPQPPAQTHTRNG